MAYCLRRKRGQGVVLNLGKVKICLTIDKTSCTNVHLRIEAPAEVSITKSEKLGTQLAR